MTWFSGKKREIPVVNFATSEVKLTTNERATYASQALNNPVFQEAAEEIRKEMIVRWTNTASGQIEDRELLYVHVRALDHLLTRLSGYLNEAKIEEYIRQKRTGIKEPA